MNFKPRPIYCGRCKRKVATHDGISSANIEVKCKKCKILIVYRPQNGIVESRPLPTRKVASGLRFY